MADAMPRSSNPPINPTSAFAVCEKPRWPSSCEIGHGPNSHPSVPTNSSLVVKAANPREALRTRDAAWSTTSVLPPRKYRKKTEIADPITGPATGSKQSSVLRISHPQKKKKTDRGPNNRPSYGLQTIHRYSEFHTLNSLAQLRQPIHHYLYKPVIPIPCA